MKSFNFLLILIVIFCSTEIAFALRKMRASLSQPGDGCVWLYDNCNFIGNRKEYCSSNSKLTDFNDVATSVRLGKGVSLTIFEHYDYQGEQFEITSDLSCFNSYLMNKTSSLKLNPATGCVWLYQDCDYSGVRKVSCSSENMASNFTDLVSSVRTGEFTSYTLFDGIGFTGKSVESKSDIQCLISYGFNDVLSSIQIKLTGPKPGCVWLYENCNYEGTIKEYCSDQVFLYKFNDMTSSLKLGKNTKVQLFEDDDYSGNSLTLISDNSCLKADFISKASSLKLLQGPFL